MFHGSTEQIDFTLRPGRPNLSLNVTWHRVPHNELRMLNAQMVIGASVIKKAKLSTYTQDQITMSKKPRALRMGL